MAGQGYKEGVSRSVFAEIRLRAAKGAHDETVAFFAVSRIKDELLLEQLALGESRISARVAAAALLRIADYHQEFSAILQRLEYEESLGEP